ncbi:hypothetical protein [Aquimarina longa]|uniref:hypothetical protein n=1 Tax=Aquimarina longa TaxID=1080221 RepID=UPI00078364F1|nr:hypothetical protein [Aquimarina longa]
MKNTSSNIKKQSNYFLWGGVTLIGVLGCVVWYFSPKNKFVEVGETQIRSDYQKQNDQENMIAEPVIEKKVRSSRFRCVNRKYPLAYGTCHPDVETLQKYLKIYKEDLGNSGTNKDGVDGMLGRKTIKAARKRLGKNSFTEKDIEGMKTDIKIIKI